MIRAVASWKSGIVNKVGINTFVDPRLERGRINDLTTEDTVEVIDRVTIIYFAIHYGSISLLSEAFYLLLRKPNLGRESRLLSIYSIVPFAKVNKGIIIVQKINNCIYIIERGLGITIACKFRIDTENKVIFSPGL